MNRSPAAFRRYAPSPRSASESRKRGAPHVHLDMTHLGAAFLRERFPRITETCRRYGIAMEREPVPVAPAAHYAMGGVRADLDGRTNVPRLFAAGEAAATGVHGANRLASNSLLEGVVFGARAGRAMREWISAPAPARSRPADSPARMAPVEEIRRLAWEKCGIVRSGEGLREACAWLEREGREVPRLTPETAAAMNLHQVALLIARCALDREESRGAHYRTDFPDKREALGKHSVIRKEGR